MFKIESYVTPILLSYVDKYVKDFKPADAQVSLWGGGVLLQNLVLKTDVLQQEVDLPFTLISGRIHELLIQVPWTKIMSEPIIITIDTIECILNLRPSTDEPKPEQSSERTQVVEAPPGYMQALVRRVVSNIAIKVHHLIVKYVQDDIVLSLNVKQLSINSAGTNWKPAFADIEAANPAIRRLIVLDDLTLCLDSTDSDGKIRFYQDPLLYRCGLEFRVLAKLVSANTRRAKSFEVELHTTKLAWGLTTAQLLLVLRLMKERGSSDNESPSPTSASQSSPAPASTLKSKIDMALHPSPSESPVLANAAEPSRRESWSDWAWSWMPTSERSPGRSEAPMTSCPVPVTFSAYLNEVSLIIKTLETETNIRKRPHVFLELTALFAAVKCSICVPTFLRVKAGVRCLVLQSSGKCTCGHLNINAASSEPTVYLSGTQQLEEGWTWPDENEVELAEAAQEKTKTEPGKETEKEDPGKQPEKESGKETEKQSEEKSNKEPETESMKESGPEHNKEPEASIDEQSQDEKEIIEQPAVTLSRSRMNLKPIIGLDTIDSITMSTRVTPFDAAEEKFWNKLSPVIHVEFIHERSPPDPFTNPYDKPPKNFEYSDWEEECDIFVNLKPMDLRISMGLLHRLSVIKSILDEVAPAPIEPMRVLTIEECEALNLNLPQRRINIEINDFRVNLYPWDHSTTEKPLKTPLVLRIELPKGNIAIAAPLYAQRVCSAAGQMPDDTGQLWQGCRVHSSTALNNIQISVCTPTGDQCKPCARIDMRFVTHLLLYPEYFEKKRSVLFSYAAKIREMNISGSAARLQAAVQILTSLMTETVSTSLRHTSLVQDSLADEDLVALDVTAEELTSRGFLTKNVKTIILTLQSLRATVFQSLPGKELQQAWLLSGPDIPTNTPFVRMAAQLCKEPFPGSADFFGLWTEPTAVAVDPLLILWLSYKPVLKPFADTASLMKFYSSTQAFSRRRFTPPSSSGRGPTRSGTTEAEQVHHKVSSMDSSSEPSEKKVPEERPSPQPAPRPQPFFVWDDLLKIHERLKQILISVDLGLILIYVTTKTATAVGCDTVRLAMEQHATSNETVVVYSVGRWSLFTSKVTKHLWHIIDQDGPTYVAEEENTENTTSFPWKMLLCDVSCYILEPFEGISTSRSEVGGGLRSRLKATVKCQPHTVLELVSTNIVMTVVTKSLQHKVIVKKAENARTSKAINREEAKLRYFTSGTDFKPATLIELLRGPTNRKKETSTQKFATTEKTRETFKPPEQQFVSGPIVSLGFNLHADTPPVVVRLGFDQVQRIAITLHCLQHVITLLQRSPPPVARREPRLASASHMSRSEMDEEEMSETTESDDRLMTIFQSYIDESEPSRMKTFFWFQWVISRVTAVVTSNNVKLAVDIDSVSMSIDLQEHYDQYKIKIDKASIKYFEQTEENTWVPGAFGGRVLELREPTNAQEDIHFLAVTITAAQMRNLPESWKEELHPKLLEQKSPSDTMWEIYAVLARMDVVIVPTSLDFIMLLSKMISTHSSCSPPRNTDRLIATFDLPYCYLNAGGMKLLFSCGTSKRRIDDTFVMTIGKVSINPHPDNPICRQPVTHNDAYWSSLPGNLEGRQYELSVKQLSIETTQFEKVVSKEEVTADSKISNENPAVKWSTTVIEPTFTSILHPLNIDLLVAPALVVKGNLICGAAVELNLTSDCVLEFNVDQLILLKGAKHVISRAGRHEKQGTDKQLKGECPYAKFLNPQPTFADTVADIQLSATTLYEDDNTRTFTGTIDSGMDTATTRSTDKSSQNQETPTRKKLSVAFVDQRTRNPSDYLEVFITTGAIEISLYTKDDGSKEIEAIRPSTKTQGSETEPKETLVEEEQEEVAKVRSLTDTNRLLDAVKLDLTKSRQYEKSTPPPKKDPKCLPLLHVTFHQPNLYFWKRHTRKSLQISLFNVWFGLGTVLMDNYWHAAIVSTTRGVPDPVTEIPPALATMKYTSGALDNASFSSIALNQKGSLTLDVERPILLSLSQDIIRRLIGISMLIKTRFAAHEIVTQEEAPEVPMPYRLRRLFINYMVEVATIQTTQIGVVISEATMGLDSLMLQITLSSRHDQLDARGLINAFLITTNKTEHENQQPILHPLHIGMRAIASWDAWQRAEGRSSNKQPAVRMLIEMDSITIDLSPNYLVIIKDILKLLRDMKNITQEVTSESSESEDSEEETVQGPKMNVISSMSMRFDEADVDDHYYMDDLRSGAFKIVRGGQLPTAYQITLHKNVISWRYPHPRAITRIVAFPLPNQNKEVTCLLEFYSLILDQWEPYMHIKLPVAEPREINLEANPPEMIFSTIWRIRVAPEDYIQTPYKFNMNKFLPNSEPELDYAEQPFESRVPIEITAEQLSGILRVDSYFGPSQRPLNRLTVQFAKLDLYAHNSLPQVYKQAANLEGYYVSKPLMHSHRTLLISAQEAMAHLGSGSPAGAMILFRTQLSSDIIDCTTGAMVPLSDDCKLQIALSTPEYAKNLARLRICTTNIRIALNVSRLRTLQALAGDWQDAIKQNLIESCDAPLIDETKLQENIYSQATRALEGRVSLWVHNTCSVALRIGQEGTDEVFPVGPGTKLAYRWRNPDAKKRLRFALAGPTTDWQWSNCITFAVGDSRIRLPNSEVDNSSPGAGVFLYVTVKQDGAHRLMRLSGRLVLANMLKWNLMYKVREQLPDNKTWRTVSSGELSEESIGQSIIVATCANLALKIRFLKHDTGWSGDIPIKECPKENVPWLVKVPSEGEVPYISVWCRVVRARSDGRIFAATWPLYVLRSNLTLDTDVLLMTDLNSPQGMPEEGSAATNLPPIIQSAPGRGIRTHIIAPGTTSAKHSLSFQYRNVECPVTREAVPLHYGVTDTSVFEKRTPVNTIEEILKEVKDWLKGGIQEADPYWPNSIVSRHWKGGWQPTIMQPRCDITVRYQAVRVGGSGCSLEVQLSPVLLLCNASPLLVTLRAHDAAPLCKLEPGSIISPPSIVLQKPFFISIEIGRETFVSRQLEVCTTDPGRYAEPPQGQFAVDHPTTIAIPCRNKVMLLSAQYEIKEEFNVIGLTSAFVFINKLDTDVSIATTAVPDVEGRTQPVQIKPKSFIPIKAFNPESVEYVPLCKFGLYERWHSADGFELTMFLSLTLPNGACTAAPVRLGASPLRKPLALIGEDGRSMAVVVTQHKHEGRWIVVLGRDPCPQYLVLNRIAFPVLIAQPRRTTDNTNDSEPQVSVFRECEGAKWWCQLNAGTSTHYSSPGYTFRKALPAHQAHPVPLLTFSLITDPIYEPEWCPPVEMTAGVQMIQLNFALTVKIRVRSYPHTTLVELQDIENTDISARDIRKRLFLSDTVFIKAPASIAPKVDKATEVKKVEETEIENEIIFSQEKMRQLDMKQLEQDLNQFVQEYAEKEAILREKVKSAESQKEADTRSISRKGEAIVSIHETTDGENLADKTSIPVQDIKDDTVNPLPISSSIPENNEPPIMEIPINNKVQESIPSETEKTTIPRRVTILHSPESIQTSEKDYNIEPNATENLISEINNSVVKNTDQSLNNNNSPQIISLQEKSLVSNTSDKVDESEIQNKELSPELLTIAGFKSSKEEETTSLLADDVYQEQSNVLLQGKDYEWDENVQKDQDRVRCTIASIIIELAAAGDTSPLLAVHIDRTYASVSSNNNKLKTLVSITDVQIDNLQYECGQFDFPVIVATRGERAEEDHWPTLWNMFSEHSIFSARLENSRVTLNTCQDSWSVMSQKYSELSEVDFHAGPVALYIEDAYIKALINLFKTAVVTYEADYDSEILEEAASIQKPLRLRLLQIQPIDLTLTLHTAVRMYIALDQSPLHLNEFKLRHMFTSTDCLVHALTVHYLSAAVLSAGWVVGGWELLGAPGALAARVGGATGGLRGVAATAAAALLRSLSACAGSLARNLDLLAGDEEHARRAAAARRRPPDTLLEGLVAGITNFAINILGAVGGLAHHPLVGVAVGETESGAAALRRSLVGVLTKPLSATADLVAYAGHGLLKQTGWDPIPQPRTSTEQREGARVGWRRDCVRWVFRLSELSPFAGFEVLLDDQPLLLLITNKYLVFASSECERVIEMIDLRHCTMGPFVGGTIELCITKNRVSRASELGMSTQDDEFHISEAAMQRVARYTGAGAGAEAAAAAAWGEVRMLLLAPAPRHAHALHAALLALLHTNADSHFPLL